MLFKELFDRFLEQSPICVMARGLMERALATPSLNALFEKTAQRQYTRELLFSTTVDVMALVVCRVRPSVNAAYQARKEEIGVSVRSLYDKLQCLEPEISAALVRHTNQRLESIIRRMKGTKPPLLHGYRTKILDGNHLASSERRPKILRDVAAGCLPGQTLVVLEPETGLASDVICCEDGHAQERKLLDLIWSMVEEGDLWIADRNFCTTKFLFGLAVRQACFIIRQHSSTLRWNRESKRRRAGRTKTGIVYERTLWLEDEEGHELEVRQIELELDKPTRDGEKTIRLLTNLPAKVRAAKVAELYRERWTIEKLFQSMTQLLRCEVNTLAYPKAALFGFCVALAASNVLATVKAALRATHKKVALDEVLSDFYVAEELAGTYRGMMIALPESEWMHLADKDDQEFVTWLTTAAQRVRLDRYPKTPRGPKKPRRRRMRYSKAKHIATARLLDQAATKN
jgi:Transposase DDE domain.